MQIQTAMESPMAQMLTLMTLMMVKCPIPMGTAFPMLTTPITKNLKQVRVMEAQKAAVNPMIMDKAKVKDRDRDKAKGRVKVKDKDRGKVKVKVKDKDKDKDNDNDNDKDKDNA